MILRAACRNGERICAARHVVYFDSCVILTVAGKAP